MFCLDIQNANLEDESGRSDACYDVDLFTEMQTWNDVELFTSLGQRFAVDLHVKDEIDNLQRYTVYFYSTTLPNQVIQSDGGREMRRVLGAPCLSIPPHTPLILFF